MQINNAKILNHHVKKLLRHIKVKIRFTYIAEHLCIPPSAALSSQTRPPFNLQLTYSRT